MSIDGCTACDHPAHDGVCGVPAERFYGAGTCLCGSLDDVIAHFGLGPAKEST